jgi:hypothetical protein
MTDLPAHHAMADLTAEPHLVEISEPEGEHAAGRMGGCARCSYSLLP